MSTLIDHPIVLDSAIEAAAKTIERIGDTRVMERFGSWAPEPPSAPEATCRLDTRTDAIDPEGLIGAVEVAALLGFRNGRRDVHSP